MTNNRNIFLALSLIIALSGTIFIWINYRISKNEFNNNLDSSNTKIHSSFNLALASTETRMLQIATFVAEDPKIQQLFLAGKKAVEKEGGNTGKIEAEQIRNTLYSLIAPSRDKLASSFDFRQLHFHLGPGSISFLRVHAPSKFGDRMDDVRHTIVAVNKTRQPVTGFETGRVVSGIRGVAPVYAISSSGERVYVGALEAGTSFQTTLDLVAKSQHVNIASLFTLQHLQNNIWPSYLKNILHEKPLVNGMMLEATTSDQIGEIQEIDYTGNQHLVKSIAGRRYHISTFPLRDFLGNRDSSRPDIGHIVIWRDVEDEHNNFFRNILINIIFGISGFCIIEVFLYLGFASVTRKISAQKEQEAREKEKFIRKQQQQRLESLQGMAGAIAHRFNNSMCVVLGNLEILEKYLSKGSTEEQICSDAFKAAQKASTVGTQMLTYVGQTILQLKHKSLPDITTECLNELEEQFPPSVHCKFVPPDNSVACKMDKKQIKKVILVLLRNALESFEQQESAKIEIRFGTEVCSSRSFPVPFHQEHSQSQKYVFCRITDNGCGIAPKDIEQLFEPFFTREFVGRGLGLAMAAGIVHSHQGAIIIESKLYEGTVSKVLLPV